MVNSLNSKDTRKRFYIYSILAMLILLLSRYFAFTEQNTVRLNKEFISITTTVIDGLFASLLTTFFITKFYFNIAPKKEKRQIDLIDQDIFIYNKYHKLRKGAEYWNFNGGIGRYTRTKTLPALLKISNKRQTEMNVNIIILDPQNESLCQKYADYKKSQDLKNKNDWNKDLVRKNLFATLLKAAHYQNEVNKLNVRIFLKQHFSLLRMDFSQDKILISKDDPNIPVISLTNKSYLYLPYVEDFNQCKNQSTELNLRKARSLHNKSITNLTIGEVNNFFENLSLNIRPDYDDLIDIINILRDDKNPYFFKLKSLIPKN